MTYLATFTILTSRLSLSDRLYASDLTDLLSRLTTRYGAITLISVLAYDGFTRTWTTIL